ncbi:MAG: hypothetical protein KGI50_08130 [Patescibacteria group bacterium]|nr:hypothetical protein [Patescibacteria group bacterium]
MRVDMFGNLIGEGEDATFEILKEMSGLSENPHTYFPKIGIYRQLPVSYVYDNEQMKYLAEFHKKSSIDIFLVTAEDEYNPRLCKIAVRVEGKKGDLKMQRQGVQKWLLSKWCQIVDIHKRNCPELFKDKVNEKSRQELVSSFRESRVELPCLGEMV